MEEWWNSMEGAGRGDSSKTGTFAQHPYLASTWVWLNSVTQSHYKQIVFQLSYLAQLALS